MSILDSEESRALARIRQAAASHAWAIERGTIEDQASAEERYNTAVDASIGQRLPHGSRLEAFKQGFARIKDLKRRAGRTQ